MTDASNQQPEPFNLNSDDVAARKRADLKRLFPEVFNEDKIDLDQLRRVMGEWVDEGTERFGLTWHGKAACMKVIQAPATGALRPDRENSVNFDESENVFIEGDNLEVLKLLQKAYFGKIKMIYIDPPIIQGRSSYTRINTPRISTHTLHSRDRSTLRGRDFLQIPIAPGATTAGG